MKVNYVTHKGSARGRFTTRARRKLRELKYDNKLDLSIVARDLGAELR